MNQKTKKQSFFDKAILCQAIIGAFLKLDPRQQIKNPVMFTVYVGSCLMTLLVIFNLFHIEDAPFGFS
jgi:K+-transporting ATPase ATPase B chain